MDYILFDTICYEMFKIVNDTEEKMGFLGVGVTRLGRNGHGDEDVLKSTVRVAQLLTF